LGPTPINGDRLGSGDHNRTIVERTWGEHLHQVQAKYSCGLFSIAGIKPSDHLRERDGGLKRTPANQVPLKAI
jgi:hypothetical protein